MTKEQKIAEWFHERQGELFKVDEIPYTREEIVSIINDSVDPVQQVIVDNERYYGVIEYREQEGWYEYTRWDDCAGEVNIGVCAKCVVEETSVSKVTRTVGDDTDTARKKFEYHYKREHNKLPSNIETGASLLSGTTIDGNETIHLGMDGSDSNVDADVIRGGVAVGEFDTVTGSLDDINNELVL